MALNACSKILVFRCKVTRFSYFSTSSGLLNKRLSQRGNVLHKMLNSQKPKDQRPKTGNFINQRLIETKFTPEKSWDIMKTRTKQFKASNTQTPQHKTLVPATPRIFSSTWCSAPNCTNSRSKFPLLSFFRFPKDEDRWRRWVINSRRLDLLSEGADYAQRNCHLCSVHFEESQFMNAQEKRRLVHDALPTLFDVPYPPPRIPPREAKPAEPAKAVVVLPPLLPEVRMKIDHSYATPEETADKQKLTEFMTTSGSDGTSNQMKLETGMSMAGISLKHVEGGFEFGSDIKVESDEAVNSSLSCCSLDDDFAEWSALRPRHKIIDCTAAVMSDADFDKEDAMSANDKGGLSDNSDVAHDTVAYAFESASVDNSGSTTGGGRTLFRVPLEELPSFMAQQKISGLYRPSAEESAKHKESEESTIQFKREIRALKTQVTRQKRRIWELEAEVVRLEENVTQPQGIMQQLDELGMSTFATSFIKSQVRRALAKNSPNVPWSRADMEVATTLYQQGVPVYRVWQRLFTMPKMKTVVAYLEKCRDEIPAAASTSSAN